MMNHQQPETGNRQPTIGNQSQTIIICFFFLVSFLVFGATLFHDFVEFDDTLLVTDNISVITVGRWSAVAWAFSHYDPELYIPLTFLSFQMDAMIGGIRPWIFHLDNVLEHTANALLATWILLLLFRRKDVAVILGLLFLVHPINVEAVAWVSGRKDLLSTMFALASAAAYLRFRETGNAKLYAAGFGFFLSGLLAKISVAPLPLALLAFDRHLDGKLTARAVWNKKGYVGIASLLGLLAILGKDQVLGRSHLSSVILLIPRTALFYAEKLLVPVNLSIFYPFDPSEVTLKNPEISISLALIAAFCACVWKLRRKYPYLALGAVWTALFLIPGFFQYYRGSELYLATDRYMYLPFLGILIAAAPVLRVAINRASRATYAVSGVTLAVLALLSFNRSRVWENTYTLFSDSLEKHETFLGYEKVGAWLLREGKRAEAVAALKRSVEIAPSSAAYFRLGVAAMEAGQTEDAKLFTLEALRLSPENPQAHVNMSKFYWDEGNRTLALSHAEKAVEFHPWNMMALGNLATMYTLSGMKDEAMEVINAILELDPENERVRPLLKQLRASNSDL